MPTPLSTEIKQLVDRPNFTHLATLMADGSPSSTPVWVGREGDRLLICTSEGSLKARNTQRDRRVALSIVDFENPYEEAQLRGLALVDDARDAGGHRNLPGHGRRRRASLRRCRKCDTECARRPCPVSGRDS